MRRFIQLARATIGTGIAFGIGGGLVLLLVGGTLSLLGGPPMRAVLATAGRGSVLGFLLGVVFSGLLAVVARGRSFEKLGVGHFAALGAGVGILAWLLMGVNGAFHAWSMQGAIMNFVLLSLMGGGSATAILLLARRASSPDASTAEIGAGAAVEVPAAATRADQRPNATKRDS